jgi:hypothetical protein
LLLGRGRRPVRRAHPGKYDEAAERCYRARREIAERGEEGSGLATAGIVLGWIGTALAALLVVALILLFLFAVAIGAGA